MRRRSGRPCPRTETGGSGRLATGRGPRRRELEVPRGELAPALAGAGLGRRAGVLAGLAEVPALVPGAGPGGGLPRVPRGLGAGLPVLVPGGFVGWLCDGVSGGGG